MLIKLNIVLVKNNTYIVPEYINNKHKLNVILKSEERTNYKKNT